MQSLIYQPELPRMNKHNETDPALVDIGNLAQIPLAEPAVKTDFFKFHSDISF